MHPDTESTVSQCVVDPWSAEGCVDSQSKLTKSLKELPHLGLTHPDTEATVCMCIFASRALLLLVTDTSSAHRFFDDFVDFHSAVQFSR